MPPIFGPPRLPDLSPLKDAVALEKELLVRDHARIGRIRSQPWHAIAAGTSQPLRAAPPAAAGGRRGNHPKGREPSRRSTADRLLPTCTSRRSTHRRRSARSGRTLAMSMWLTIQRVQPGVGDIDWRAGIQALADTGFAGYLTYECRIAGEPKAALAQSVTLLRETVKSVQSG